MAGPLRRGRRAGAARRTSTSSPTGPRARGCGTSRVVATSTSGRASRSPTPGTGTRTSSTRSTRQVDAPAAHVGGAQAPAVHRGVRGDRRAGAVPRPSQGVPLQQRRRGGRRRHQAGPPHHRAGPGSSPSGGRSTAAPWAPPASPPPRPPTRRATRPLLPGRAHRALRHPDATPTTGRVDATLDRLARAPRRTPDAVAAMIVEPVLGEGGYIVPPVAWLRGPAAALRRPRDPAGVRRGADAASGAPAAPSRPRPSASRPTSSSSPRAWRRGCRWRGSWPGAELMDRWPNGTHGSTFGGNPVSCAAAVATIEVLEARGPVRPGHRARRPGAAPPPRPPVARRSSRCAASAP